MASQHTVLIAGGSGFIGSALTNYLVAEGHRVAHLSRRNSPNSTVPVFAWNPGETELDLNALSAELGTPITAVVNLAGYSISKMPWTKARKALILSSRLDATTTLVRAIRRASTPPQVFINGSAVGYYGSRGNELVTESSSPGTGFLADVVSQWEKATEGTPASTRLVLARTGLVLGRCGALTPLKLLTRFFLSGPLAGGKDWWPWISLRDEVRALAFLLSAQISGPVNLVAPNSATSGQVMKELATQMKRPFWLPAPGFAISLLLGQAGRELLLSSQHVVPDVLLNSGFTFQDSDISEGVSSALR